jgi:basic membrane protein A and related proteins
VKRVAQIAALSAAAALALAACGDAPEEATGSATSTTAAADFTGCMVSDAGGFDDGSFNESSYAGLERAVEELGIKKAEAESTDAGQYNGNLDSMMQNDCDLIITVGFNLADATAAAAEGNPDQKFALIDSTVDPAMENVKPILFNTHEAAYLAGYLAAGITETGTVATYGGFPIPSVTIFMDGFVDGVAKYNEDHGTEVKALGWDKEAQDGEFTDTFDDKGQGVISTNNFIAAGADVILPVAGPVGEGSLSAASQHDGVKVIWVDADGYEMYPEYQDIIPTSVLKGMEQAVFDVLYASTGTAFNSDAYVGTLANEGIGLAEVRDESVPEDLLDEIETLKQQIVDGELVVESPSSISVD